MPRPAEVFRMDDEGIAEVSAEVESSLKDTARNAGRLSCFVISLETDPRAR